MEFYLVHKLGVLKEKVFQFPTGWNSTSSFQLVKGCRVCFNSQRDGILHYFKVEFLFSSMFQFPTGWNSTHRSQRLIIITSIVSIPNGMEFYNSDLHIETEFSLFQFPMGWNSTLQGIGDDFKIVGFNSQRDGILLCKA